MPCSSRRGSVWRAGVRSAGRPVCSSAPRRDANSQCGGRSVRPARLHAFSPRLLRVGVLVVVERERRASARPARPLDAQHPGEGLPVHGDTHEVVAARDGGRSAEPAESPAPAPAPGRATKRLGDEAESAQTAAAAPTGPALVRKRDADQLAQRAEEAYVGLLRSRLPRFLLSCAALRAPGRARRAGRRLARPLDEASRRGGGATSPAATASTAATTSTPSKPESLRQALQITGQQGRLQGPEH